MSISLIPLIANMVHMIIWRRGWAYHGYSTTGLTWFKGDDQRSGWGQLEIYFGAACSGERMRERERENTRPPENKKQGKETKNKKNKFGTPQNEKGEKSNTEKRRKWKNKRKKKNKKPWKEKKKRKHHYSTPRKKNGMKKRKRIRRYLLIYVCHSLIYE